MSHSHILLLTILLVTFESSSAQPPTQSLLIANDGSGEDWFGYTVAIDETATIALIGAHRMEGDNVAKAFIFERR